MWLDEKITNTSIKLSAFSTCCTNGKVFLPPLQELPPPLDSLLTETDPRSCSFCRNIRMYNSVLAFTSIGAKIDPEVTGTSGIYTFHIHGEMYHRIGTLFPDIETQPQFAQIYIFDTDNELQNRLNLMPRLDSTILIELQQMLHDINPYVNVFQQAANLLKHDQSLDLKLIITDNRTKDPRRYNAPNASEVAIIMVEDAQGAKQLNWDIVLHTHEGGLQQISELYRGYAPLHYVLMFPRGEDGWHPNIPICDTSDIQDEEDSDINNEDEDSKSNKCVTAMNYFAYRLQVGRPGEALTLHQYGRLFQQWIVDMYAVIEQTHLNYLRYHQLELRAGLYCGLQDALSSGDNTTNVGQRIVLPSSFTGGLDKCISCTRMECLLYVLLENLTYSLQ